jgi:ABC-type sugar transport system permease subunit
MLDRFTPVIMLLPALIAILIVQIYPSIDSIRMSFFDISLLKPARPFVGLQNYQTALSDPIVLRVIVNTLLFAVFSLALASVFAMIAALELNKKYPGRGFFRAVFIAPWVTPPLVTALIWKLLVSESFSPINALLMRAGLIMKPLSFLGQTDIYLGFFSVPMLSIIVINVWSMFPFMMVMFLAGLQTVPTELHEAASIDGASKWRDFWHITIPSLLPVIETSILLQGIWQFNNFNISYLVTKGGPLNLTEVMAVRVYSEAFINFRYGLGAAVSVFMLLIVLIPAFFYLRANARSNAA